MFIAIIGVKFMIELNGIYKLKKIKGFKNHDTTNYKVIAHHCCLNLQFDEKKRHHRNNHLQLL